MTTRNYLLGAFIIVVVGGVFFFLHRHTAEAPQSGTATSSALYSNEVYAYTFSYPQAYTVNEYTSEYVTLADPLRSSDADLVNINVDSSDAVTSTSFSDFVYADAERYCAADGPTGSQNCPSITRSQPIVTANGLSGESFYLNLETTIGTSTSDREAGPFWAFNISANSSNAQYAVLLVYPAHFAEGAPSDTEVDLAQGIANSLRIDKK